MNFPATRLKILALIIDDLERGNSITWTRRLGLDPENLHDVDSVRACMCEVAEWLGTVRLDRAGET